MKQFDVVIIGGGPGGYVAAIRSAQLGLKTAIVEKAKLGGMCLNWGCVPSRRLMESARLYDRVMNSAVFGIDGIDGNAVNFNWKRAVTEKDRIVTKLVKGVEFLMKKNKVEVFSGEARLIGGTQVLVGDETLEAKKTIIATGSRPNRKPLAALPDKMITEIDDFYSRGDIPDSILVAGGDTIAAEMASMLRLIGKQITVVATEEKVMGWLDGSLSKFIAEKFKKQGITVYTGTKISGASGKRVKAGEHEIECDMVLNCERRAAVLPPMDDVPLDVQDGFVSVNEFLQTSVPSVYAIGDVTGRVFAHIASAQGVAAVNHIAGLKEPVDYLHMPVTLYMDPEIGSVGFTEEELKAEGREYLVGEFPMNVNSKALVEGNSEGFVRVLAEPKYGELLGVHVVAYRATDMISEAAMCMKTEGTLDDLTRVVHAHPTVSETVLEAGFKAAGKPLHV